MKKKIIIIAAVLLVAVIAVVGIILAVSKESKQLTVENLNTYYDVKIEITDYVRGEKDKEFLGIVATYSPSTAKIHITATPKDTLLADSAKLTYAFDSNYWDLVDEKEAIEVKLNAEGATDVYIDVESDLKFSVVGEPELKDVKLTDALGTLTYKKFFNKF